MQHKAVFLGFCNSLYSLQRDQAWPRWSEVAAQKIWPVLEAVLQFYVPLMIGVVNTRNM